MITPWVAPKRIAITTTTTTIRVIIIVIIMVIFKRLSLKILSASQKHKGYGGDGVTKIILQMFLLDSA